MLTNAVSSAVGRLYGSAKAVEPRLQVQRIDAVARLAATSAAATPAQHNQRDEREHAAQRSALTSGVRMVFEAASVTDTGFAELGDTEPGANQAAAASANKPEIHAPDPHLEEAILRFIHAVFRSIAEAEGEGPTDLAVAGDRADAIATGTDPAKALYPGFNHSREVLGRRIQALAERLDAAGEASDLLSDGSVDAAATTELEQSFADVLQALGVKLGNAVAADGQPAAPTRGNLVNLMRKLAHAMQGAPPVDEGLPTVGGLLHARA